MCSSDLRLVFKCHFFHFRGCRQFWHPQKNRFLQFISPSFFQDRLIFGEADFLPGIVIDKFSDVLVVESLALGIDRFKQLIVDDLKEILKEYGMPIRGVYERSDAKVRQLEGMERVKGFIGEEFDTKVMITENGVKYYVDVKDGQKTGFFLDQKYNRRDRKSVV